MLLSQALCEMNCRTMNRLAGYVEHRIRRALVYLYYTVTPIATPMSQHFYKKFYSTVYLCSLLAGETISCMILLSLVFLSDNCGLCHLKTLHWGSGNLLLLPSCQKKEILVTAYSFLLCCVRKGFMFLFCCFTISMFCSDVTAAVCAVTCYDL